MIHAEWLLIPSSLGLQWKSLHWYSIQWVALALAIYCRVEPTAKISSLKIELCLWILPSILCSNARAPVAQLVRTSDWHSEERIDDNTQKTQVQILVGSQCLFQEQTINISSHRAVTYILGSQLYLMLCWESEKYIYRKNSGIQLAFLKWLSRNCIRDIFWDENIIFGLQIWMCIFVTCHWKCVIVYSPR